MRKCNGIGMRAGATSTCKGLAATFFSSKPCWFAPKEVPEHLTAAVVGVLSQLRLRPFRPPRRQERDCREDTDRD